MFMIGEFAQIGRVTGRLLRYYDQLGLLTPEHTDRSTGYRYYSARQLPRLNRILALKALGFSLDKIATLLDERCRPSGCAACWRCARRRSSRRWPPSDDAAPDRGTHPPDRGAGRHDRL